MLNISEIAKDKRRIGNRTQAFKWYHFQWPWVPFDPHFKVMNSTSNNSTNSKSCMIYSNGSVSSDQGHGVTIDSVNVLCAQRMHNLLATAKFLYEVVSRWCWFVCDVLHRMWRRNVWHGVCWEMSLWTWCRLWPVYWCMPWLVCKWLARLQLPDR